MITFALEHHADAKSWLKAAQKAVAAGIEPDRVEWQVGSQGASLFSASPQDPDRLRGNRSVRFSTALTRLVRQAICHNDPKRLSLLYRLAWRLHHGENGLLQNTVDADVHAVSRMAQATRRDAHKMKAFVRFRAMDNRLISWFEPEHQIVDAVAPFFRNRFANEHWTIFTPSRSATWDRQSLHCAPTGDHVVRPQEDELELYWKKYYASIFNPARLKVPMMRQEMPKKYWKNLPEAELIPELIAGAEKRARSMVKDAVTAPAKKGRTRYVRQTPRAEPSASPLSQLSQQVQACRRCPLWQPATQAVPGEGNPDAAIVILGDQPGDVEDLRGRPFAGPAGDVLRSAMQQSGMAVGSVYMTNSVKHFRFESRGKRRMHKNPSRQHIDACRHWLEHELALVRPELVVTLGRSALFSLTGTTDTLGEIRGSVIRSNSFSVLPTWHPAAILRAPDGERMGSELVSDLQRALTFVRQGLEKDSGAQRSLNP